VAGHQRPVQFLSTQLLQAVRRILHQAHQLLQYGTAKRTGPGACEGYSTDAWAAPPCDSHARAESGWPGHATAIAHPALLRKTRVEYIKIAATPTKAG
jgi:hypothetical protein